MPFFGSCNRRFCPFHFADSHNGSAVSPRNLVKLKMFILVAFFRPVPFADNHYGSAVYQLNLVKLLFFVLAPFSGCRQTFRFAGATSAPLFPNGFGRNFDFYSFGCGKRPICLFVLRTPPRLRCFPMELVETLFFYFLALSFGCRQTNALPFQFADNHNGSAVSQ